MIRTYSLCLFGSSTARGLPEFPNSKLWLALYFDHCTIKMLSFHLPYLACFDRLLKLGWAQVHSVRLKQKNSANKLQNCFLFQGLGWGGVGWGGVGLGGVGWGRGGVGSSWRPRMAPVRSLSLSSSSFVFLKYTQHWHAE